MLKNAAVMLNFTYTIENPPDGSWGHIKPDASWNGLVYHASQDIVDFVICDVFIVFGRSQVHIKLITTQCSKIRKKNCNFKSAKKHYLHFQK